MTNQKILLLFFGTLAGIAAYTIIGSLGLYLLRIGWADYAIRSEDKSFTLEMLLSRLFIGILAAVTAGISAEKIANDNGRSAWFVGAIVFCVGSYIHFITAVWGEYLLWYHFSYVLPIIPITKLSPYFFCKRKWI